MLHLRFYMLYAGTAVKLYTCDVHFIAENAIPHFQTEKFSRHDKRSDNSSSLKSFILESCRSSPLVPHSST